MTSRQVSDTKRKRIRRWFTAMVVVDVAVVIAIVAIIFDGWGFAKRALGLEKIRGSQAPPGLKLPTAANSAVTPALSIRKQSPALVMVTCTNCPVAAVTGQFLSKLDVSKISDDVEIHVVTWGKNTEQWRARYFLPERMNVHTALTLRDASRVQKTWYLPANGAAMFSYDAEHRWVSTFHAGQLQTGDVIHDARLL